MRNDYDVFYSNGNHKIYNAPNFSELMRYILDTDDDAELITKIIIRN